MGMKDDNFEERMKIQCLAMKDQSEESLRTLVMAMGPEFVIFLLNTLSERMESDNPFEAVIAKFAIKAVADACESAANFCEQESSDD